MLYSNNKSLKSILIFALFLIPLTEAVADDLPQQVSRLETQLMEANAKIAVLETDQHKTAMTVSSLQTGLETVDQQINGLKSGHSQLSGFAAATRRTANGHGR